MFSVKKFDVMANKEINYGGGYTYDEVKTICRGYKHDTTLEIVDFGTFTRSYFTRKNSRYMYLVDNYEDRTAEETAEETPEQPATPEPAETPETNTREILSICSAIISTADKFKSSYFFRSPGNAKARRDYEKYWTIAQHTFEYNGDIYTVEYNVTCSCNNVYAKGYYTRNGKKVTLRTIKKIVSEIGKGV